MKKFGKTLLIGLTTLVLASCGGADISKEFEKASVVTDPVEQQQIIDQVFAVDFAALGNVNMDVTINAKISIITLELTGTYVTSNWGTSDANTALSLDVTKPSMAQTDDFIVCNGNGKTIDIAIKDLIIANQQIMESTSGTSNSIYDVSDSEVVKKSLLASLAGLDSEDVSQVRKNVDGDNTTYYIAAEKETIENLFASFGVSEIEVVSEPVLGFTMNTATNKIAGLSLNFTGSYSGLEMEFSLVGVNK